MVSFPKPKFHLPKLPAVRAKKGTPSSYVDFETHVKSTEISTASKKEEGAADRGTSLRSFTVIDSVSRHDVPDSTGRDSAPDANRDAMEFVPMEEYKADDSSSESDAHAVRGRPSFDDRSAARSLTNAASKDGSVAAKSVVSVSVTASEEMVEMEVNEEGEKSSYAPLTEPAHFSFSQEDVEKEGGEAVNIWGHDRSEPPKGKKEEQISVGERERSELPIDTAVLMEKAVEEIDEQDRDDKFPEIGTSCKNTSDDYLSKIQELSNEADSLSSSKTHEPFNETSDYGYSSKSESSEISSEGAYPEESEPAATADFTVEGIGEEGEEDEEDKENVNIAARNMPERRSLRASNANGVPPSSSASVLTATSRASSNSLVMKNYEAARNAMIARSAAKSVASRSVASAGRNGRENYGVGNQSSKKGGSINCSQADRSKASKNRSLGGSRAGASRAGTPTSRAGSKVSSVSGSRAGLNRATGRASSRVGDEHSRNSSSRSRSQKERVLQKPPNIPAREASATTIPIKNTDRAMESPPNQFDILGTLPRDISLISSSCSSLSLDIHQSKTFGNDDTASSTTENCPRSQNQGNASGDGDEDDPRSLHTTEDSANFSGAWAAAAADAHRNEKSSNLKAEEGAGAENASRGFSIRNPRGFSIRRLLGRNTSSLPPVDEQQTTVPRPSIIYRDVSAATKVQRMNASSHTPGEGAASLSSGNKWRNPDIQYYTAHTAARRSKSKLGRDTSAATNDQNLNASAPPGSRSGEACELSSFWVQDDPSIHLDGFLDGEGVNAPFVPPTPSTTDPQIPSAQSSSANAAAVNNSTGAFNVADDPSIRVNGFPEEGIDAPHTPPTPVASAHSSFANVAAVNNRTGAYNAADDPSIHVSGFDEEGDNAPYVPPTPATTRAHVPPADSSAANAASVNNSTGAFNAADDPSIRVYGSFSEGGSTTNARADHNEIATDATAKNATSTEQFHQAAPVATNRHHHGLSNVQLILPYLETYGHPPQYLYTMIENHPPPVTMHYYVNTKQVRK